MSTVQFRAIAVCCWLVTLCLGIFAAATYEDYAGYRDGERVRATVTEVKKTSVALAYDYQGKPRMLYLHDRSLKRGDGVELAVDNSGAVRRVSELSVPVIAAGVAILGFVGSIALGVWLWRRPTVAARRRANRTGPFDAIIEAVARTRNISIGFGIFMVASAGFFAVILAFDREATPRVAIVVVVLTAVTLALAVFLLVRGYRLRDPRRNKIVELIEQQPAEIAWFYVHRVVSRGMETLSIFIWKTNGKSEGIALVREDVETVMGELERRAPHALQGFTPENEKMYRAQPTRWRPATRA